MSRARVLAWLHRHPTVRAWALLGPGMAWLALFFLVPLLIMAAYSLMLRGTYGGVRPGFTLEHYRRFFDPLYLDVLRRTGRGRARAYPHRDWEAERSGVGGGGGDERRAGRDRFIRGNELARC